MVGHVTHSQDPMPGKYSSKKYANIKHFLISVAAAVHACGSSSTRSPPSLTGATFTAQTLSLQRSFGRGPGAVCEKINRLNVDDKIIMRNNYENKVREPALPTRSQCGFSSSPPERPSDLVAGDERAIVQPGLTAVHTLFLREHNRWAVNSHSHVSS